MRIVKRSESVYEINDFSGRTIAYFDNYIDAQKFVDRVNNDVEHPKHYNDHPSGVECIQITEHMNFCLGNAMKYVWRAGMKESESKEKDLQKAIWYLNREIEMVAKLRRVISNEQVSEASGTECS